MATVTRDHVITKIDDSFGATWHVLWEGLDGDDNGEALEMPAWSDRSVQFVGTFDSGTVILQGSNDGVTWATLQDLEGTAISTTSAALVSVMEITRYVRPSVSGGGGSCDIDVHMIITGFKR